MKQPLQNGTLIPKFNVNRTKKNKKSILMKEIEIKAQKHNKVTQIYQIYLTWVYILNIKIKIVIENRLLIDIIIVLRRTMGLLIIKNKILITILLFLPSVSMIRKKKIFMIGKKKRAISKNTKE